MSEAARKQSLVHSIIQVKRADLPLSCPRRGEEVWNKHPRVYLAFGSNGEAVCPYCSTRYRLTD